MGPGHPRELSHGQASSIPLFGLPPIGAGGSVPMPQPGLALTTAAAPFALKWAIASATGPAPRYGQVMATDPKDGYVLLTGGLSSVNSTGYSDSWGFANGSWKILSPLHHPPVTYGASMTYDAADGYMVLYGGCYSLATGCPAGTWTFSGGNWTKLNPPVAPPLFLEWPSMTYDAKDGYVVLFGGADATATCGCSWVTNYTWKFSAGTWTNISSKVAPPPRYGGGMVYDVHDSAVVLFGGGSNAASCVGTCSIGDTWTFAGGAWTNVTPTFSPPARYFGGLAYDTQNHSVVLFGGRTYLTALRDTWEFHGGVWSVIAAFPAPLATYGPTVASTASGNAVIVYTSVMRYPNYFGVTWRLH